MVCAHLDVVPTPDLELWKHPPFSGVLAPDEEGRPCVWGRGAHVVSVSVIIVSSVSVIIVSVIIVIISVMLSVVSVSIVR